MGLMKIQKYYFSEILRMMMLSMLLKMKWKKAKYVNQLIILDYIDENYVEGAKSNTPKKKKKDKEDLNSSFENECSIF